VSREAIVLPTSRSSESNITEWTIERVTDWLEGGSAWPGIMWISGLPDSSSVRSIIDLCLSRSILGGSFSFSTRKGKEQVQRLMPTLAYQMITNQPQLESVIASAMSIDPKLPERPIGIQFQRLLVDPLQSSAARNLSSPPLIVIDGLEMYQDDDTRRAIVSLIEMSITATRLPVRYLFTSQPAVDYHYVPGLHQDTHIHIHASVLHIATPYPATQSSPDRGKRTSAPGFPVLVSAHRTRGSPQSYSRSMMTLGHGFPLWLPSDGSNTAYGEQGVRLGDVGYITSLGQFIFCFNIFEPRESPIHARLAQNFEPIQPGLDLSEVVRDSGAFQKGAVLLSEGLTVEKESDPLYASFKFYLFSFTHAYEDLYDYVLVKRTAPFSFFRMAPQEKIWYRQGAFMSISGNGLLIGIKTMTYPMALCFLLPAVIRHLTGHSLHFRKLLDIKTASFGIDGDLTMSRAGLAPEMP
jgi:hypothetical protein